MSRRSKRQYSPPLSDLEDVRDRIPTLDEDFHYPCPGCEKELVIRADQPIRRVKCGRCNEEYTLDRRIGGELCLLRYGAREYAGQRAFVERVKAMKFRVLTLVLGFVIVASVVAALAYDSVFALGAAVAIVVGLARANPGKRDLRQEKKTRKQRRYRRETRRAAVRDRSDRPA